MSPILDVIQVIAGIVVALGIPGGIGVWWRARVKRKNAPVSDAKVLQGLALSYASEMDQKLKETKDQVEKLVEYLNKVIARAERAERALVDAGLPIPVTPPDQKVDYIVVPT